jgi:hypothetical protein
LKKLLLWRAKTWKRGKPHERPSAPAARNEAIGCKWTISRI